MDSSLRDGFASAAGVSVDIPVACGVGHTGVSVRLALLHPPTVGHSVGVCDPAHLASTSPHVRCRHVQPAWSHNGSQVDSVRRGRHSPWPDEAFLSQLHCEATSYALQFIHLHTHTHGSIHPHTHTHTHTAGVQSTWWGRS